jgi:hypothetical protein
VGPVPRWLRAVYDRIDDADFLRGFHGWCTAAWIPITVLSYALGWLKSVTFVSVISMVALFLGSFSSWQASRIETAMAAKDDCPHCGG